MARRRLGALRRLCVALVKPPMLLFTARQWQGTSHIPAHGGAILVANHYSQFDPLVMAHFVYGSGRWPRFLAKSGMFDVPVLGFLMRGARQIPVYRGSVDAIRALRAAVEAVEAGNIVIIYPEGTTTRDDRLWPMRAKTGAVRLALATGVPLIPVVSWGAQRVHDPRRRGLRPVPRTPVTVVAGAPIDLSPWQDQPVTNRLLNEATEVVMARLTEMLAEIRDEPRVGEQVQP